MKSLTLVLMVFFFAFSSHADKVNLSDGETYYKITDKKADKNLVFLHGGSFPSWTWLRIKGKLAKLGFNVLVFDFYGMGKSQTLNVQRYTRDMYLRQLDEIIKHTGFDQKPLYLVGSAIGASLATIYSNQNDNVEKLILMSPAYHYRGVNGPLGEELFRLMDREPESPWLRLLLKKRVETQVEEYLARIPENQRRLIKSLIDKEIKPFSYFDNFYRRLIGDLYTSYDRAYSRAARIGKPTLLLAGQFDGDAPQFQIQQIADRHDNMQVNIFEGSHSEFTVTKTKEMIDLMSAFLAAE